MRQDTIAKRIGRSRETVNRSFKKLHNKGLITSKNRGVKRTCRVKINPCFLDLSIRNIFADLLPALRYLPLIAFQDNHRKFLVQYRNDLRKFLVQYRNDTPIGMLEMANAIGICKSTLICFFKGAEGQIKTLKKIDAYIKTIIDKPAKYF